MLGSLKESMLLSRPRSNILNFQGTAKLFPSSKTFRIEEKAISIFIKVK